MTLESYKARRDQTHKPYIIQYTYVYVHAENPNYILIKDPYHT